jgi:COP9 signalosome complex subunit 3
MKQCSKAYDALADIFGEGSPRRLQAEITAGSNIWFEVYIVISSYHHFTDCGQGANMGLVQQLTARLPRFFVLRLQKTYSAIPLGMVARWLGLSADAAHNLIQQLIDEDAIDANIILRNGADEDAIVRFSTEQSKGPSAKSEEELHAKLIAQTARTNAMVEYVKLADRRLVLTKEYIDNLRKRARNKDDDGAAVDMDVSWDRAEYQDEDLMLDS